jgi:hypothetical protein
MSSATITVVITGTIPTGGSVFYATLLKNGTRMGQLVVTNAAAYIFSGVSASATDTLDFDLST